MTQPSSGQQPPHLGGGKCANGRATAAGDSFEITVRSESKFGGNVEAELAIADPSAFAALGWSPSAEIVTFPATSGESPASSESLAAGSLDDGGVNRMLWLELPPVILCGLAARNTSRP